MKDAEWNSFVSMPSVIDFFPFLIYQVSCVSATTLMSLRRICFPPFTARYFVADDNNSMFVVSFATVK